MTNPIPVTVLRDGSTLTWACDTCPEAGTGLEALAAHHRATGHDPYSTRGPGA